MGEVGEYSVNPIHSATDLADMADSQNVANGLVAVPPSSAPTKHGAENKKQQQSSERIKRTMINAVLEVMNAQKKHSEANYPKMEQVHVEVFQTFMVKCLRDGVSGTEEDGHIFMVGTLIQRCVNDPRITVDEDGYFRFWYDLTEEERTEHINTIRAGHSSAFSSSGVNVHSSRGHASCTPNGGKALVRGVTMLMNEDPYHRPFFTYRVNETPYDVSDSIRKVTIVRCALDDSRNGLSVPCSITNMTVMLPTILRSVFNGKPYQISTCEAMIELTSRYAGDAEYRPTLVANREGMDNIVCIRDPSEIDEIQRWDMMWNFPTIEIPNEGKFKKGKMVHYTPKILVYFYLTTSPMEGFIKTFMPILFATVAQTLNAMHSNFDLSETPILPGSGEEVDYLNVYLTNTITIAVAVIFVLPEISSHKHSFNHALSSNEIYICMFFAGLTLGCFHNRPCRQFSIILMWSCLAIPILSILRYYHTKRSLNARSSSVLLRGEGLRRTLVKKEQEQGRLSTSNPPHLGGASGGGGGGLEMKSSSLTNKSGADLHGHDMMNFFDNLNGDVSHEIMEQSGSEQLFAYAQCMIYDKKRHMILGKAKNELRREGTQWGYFFPHLVARAIAREQEQAKRTVV